MQKFDFYAVILHCNSTWRHINTRPEPGTFLKTNTLKEPKSVSWVQRIRSTVQRKEFSLGRCETSLPRNFFFLSFSLLVQSRSWLVVVVLLLVLRRTPASIVLHTSISLLYRDIRFHISSRVFFCHYSHENHIPVFCIFVAALFVILFALTPIR